MAVAAAATLAGVPAASADHGAETPVDVAGDAGVVLEPRATFAQLVEPRVVLRPTRDESTRLSAKGNDLWEISGLGSFDLPEAALRAYKTAAATMARTQPACELPWTLLAGIGRVESDHGRYGGSVLGSDGVPRPAIRGIALNGVGPVAAIPDSDNGRFDGDKIWDRAVGPMQFIPTTWAYSGRDGDGNGEASPNDLDDAALAAAEYLCPASGSILGSEAMKSAIFRYNHSDYYVALVMAFEAGYRTGSFAIPSPPPPATGRDAGDSPGGSGRGATKPGGSGAQDVRGGGHDAGDGDDSVRPKGSKDEGPAPKPTPNPKPAKPKPAPAPKPVPKPTPSPKPTPPPTYVEMTGQFTACGGWCIDGELLDLGPQTKLSQSAAADYDGDGILEQNGEEFEGLSGSTVQVVVRTDTAPLLVVTFAGQTY